MATLTEHDLWEALDGLKTGWYSTREIHDRCVAWAERAGREPAHINVTARTLKAAVFQVRRNTKVTKWLIYAVEKSDLES